MSIPELRQVTSLCQNDFEQYPVWIGVHTNDCEKPWYETTDENTYRPWTEALPLPANVDFLLVSALFQLHDKTVFKGFVTPTSESWGLPIRPGLPALSERFGGSAAVVLGFQLPRIFVSASSTGQQWIAFWGGIAGIPLKMRRRLYELLERGPDAIFPIRFKACPGLSLGMAAGQLDGFYKAMRGNGVEIEL